MYSTSTTMCMARHAFKNMFVRQKTIDCLVDCFGDTRKEVQSAAARNIAALMEDTIESQEFWMEMAPKVLRTINDSQIKYVVSIAHANPSANVNANAMLACSRVGFGFGFGLDFGFRPRTIVSANS